MAVPVIWYERKVYVRVYNIPQITDKQHEYKIQMIMFAVAEKLKLITNHRLNLGMDKKRGEYLELIGKRKTRKPMKDWILWMDYYN